MANMKFENISREQLIDEVIELRQQVAELETLVTECRQEATALQQRTNRQSALRELDRAIASSLRLGDVYHAFARHSIRFLPYDCMSINVLEGDDIHVAYVTGENYNRNSQDRVITLSAKSSSISWVVTQGQPMLRHNITAEARFTDDRQLLARGIRSSMVIPLRVKGKVFGTWNVGNKQVGAYSPDDLDVAQSLADQLAAAIENARLFEQAQQEIRERQQVEVALRKSEERLRQVIVSISDHIYMGVYVFEDDLMKPAEPASHYISPNVEALTGYPQKKFTANWHFWRLLIHPDDQAVATLKSEQMISNNNSQVEYRLKRADDSIIWVRDSRQIVVDGDPSEDSRHVTVYGVVSDITERKQLEEQLYQSQKMEAIGRLAGGVAHDFNNLLTVINGYSEIVLLRHLNSDDPVRRDVEHIKSAGEQAALLTRQLLAFSRKQVLQPEVLDLNVVVGDMDQMLRRLIGEDIDLITVLASDLGSVKADPGQMQQVVMNLAVNARDAMPNGGKLTVGTANVDLDETFTRRYVDAKPGPYVMLALSDNGQGMDTKTKAHIFEPFFTTKEKGKGTGLGLATVHGIISQSGGHILVYSESGRGTTFKIYLPRIEDGNEYNRADLVPAKSVRGTETVLLVEDDGMIRQLAHQVLIDEGYTVLEAHSGLEAHRISEQYTNPVQLLVTDVVMPGGINGRELADQLVTLHPEMKVLFISGYTNNAIVHHGVLDPQMAFLQKPFTPATFVRKIREVLDAA